MIKREMKSGIEHIYFNSRIDNIYSGDETPVIAQTTQKTNNILDRQKDYEMALTFFRIKGDIPIMYMPIQEGINPDINRTNYGVCLSYAGLDYTSRINYTYLGVTPTILPKSPLNNNGQQDFITNESYYAIYYFQHFIDMVNSALLAVYTAFNTANPGIHNSAPWFQYNATNGLISLIGEYSYSGGTGAKLYMNALLYNYFEGIQVYFNGFNQVDFKDYQFQFLVGIGNQNGYAIQPTAITNPPAYLIYTQEADYRYLWQNIISILITSPSIQMRSEYIPSSDNKNILNQTSVNTSIFNPNSTQALSYFDIFYESGRISVREPIYYNPQIYKWIDLIGDAPLNQISINISMILNNGAVIPLYLQSDANNGVDIKFVFRKKLL